MPGIEFRAFYLVALALIACGSSEPDFSHPDRGGAGSGAGGADPGGSGGTAPGGAGATQGGAGAQSGGAAGSSAGGNAGDGSSGATASGGSSGVATGGSSGTGSTQFSCGPLRCFGSQQWCRVTKPPVSGGSTQYMCQPFPDSCSAYDCNCVCQQSPCESTSACPCSTEGGGVTVTCGP